MRGSRTKATRGDVLKGKQKQKDARFDERPFACKYWKMI